MSGYQMYMRMTFVGLSSAGDEVVLFTIDYMVAGKMKISMYEYIPQFLQNRPQT